MQGKTGEKRVYFLYMSIPSLFLTQQDHAQQITGRFLGHIHPDYFAILDGRNPDHFDIADCHAITGLGAYAIDLDTATGGHQISPARCAIGYSVLWPACRVAAAIRALVRIDSAS